MTLSNFCCAQYKLHSPVAHLTVGSPLYAVTNLLRVRSRRPFDNALLNLNFIDAR